MNHKWHPGGWCARHLTGRRMPEAPARALKQCALVLICLAALTNLSACKSSASPSATPKPSDSARFESAIARKIFSDVLETLPFLPATQRHDFVEKQAQRFAKSVDRTRLIPSLQYEGALLEELLKQETLHRAELGFGARAQTQSSLDWSEQQFETAIITAIQELDTAIANNHKVDSVRQLLDATRAEWSYPQDSIAGRQDYLDSLMAAMARLEQDWLALKGETPSTLVILGHEQATSRIFQHDYNAKNDTTELKINLAVVENLPLPEVECIAAYYGYPGLQVFSNVPATSLRKLIELPGFREGFALTTLDLVGNQHCDWFTKLKASAALVDLRLGQKRWDKSAGLRYLRDSTPYSESRLRDELAFILNNPGYALAVFAGRIKFTQWLEPCAPGFESDCTLPQLRRATIRGPVPFDMLDPAFKTGDEVPGQ